MMKVFVVLLLIVCALGCIDAEELYIDKNCSVHEIHAVFSAVDKLNAVVGYDELVIIGTVKVDYAVESSDWNDQSVIMCIDESIDGEKYFPKFNISAGRTWYDDIFIRSDWTTYGEYGLRGFKSVVMHELMHFVGVSGDDHTDDAEDVICKYISDTLPIEYSDHDKALLRQYSRR